jgi:hypothetical protein
MNVSATAPGAARCERGLHRPLDRTETADPPHGTRQVTRAHCATRMMVFLPLPTVDGAPSVRVGPAEGRGSDGGPAAVDDQDLAGHVAGGSGGWPCSGTWLRSRLAPRLAA